MQEQEQDFAVRISRRAYELLVARAKSEDRTLKATLSRILSRELDTGEDDDFDGGSDEPSKETR